MYVEHPKHFQVDKDIQIIASLEVSLKVRTLPDFWLTNFSSQIHFRSGIGGDSKVTDAAKELIVDLDKLISSVKEQVNSLEGCIAQLDQYQQVSLFFSYFWGWLTSHLVLKMCLVSSVFFRRRHQLFAKISHQFWC